MNSIETDNDEKDVRDHLGDPNGSVCLTGRVQRFENRAGRSMQRIDTWRLSDHRAARNRHMLRRIRPHGLGEAVSRKNIYEHTWLLAIGRRLAVIERREAFFQQRTLMGKAGRVACPKLAKILDLPADCR